MLCIDLHSPVRRSYGLLVASERDQDVGLERVVHRILRVVVNRLAGGPQRLVVTIACEQIASQCVVADVLLWQAGDGLLRVLMAACEVLEVGTTLACQTAKSVD